ncbi:MAG: MarR family winged helix-turn-helix transcriptional regulator [Rhodomicrobium sp.]
MRPLTHRIYLLGQTLSSSAEKALRAEFDLGFSDYLALHGVASRQLSSQAELARFVGVTDAGISRIVSRLAARELLAAADDPSNRRRSKLALTAKGAKLVQKAGALLEEGFGRKAIRAASREDLATFERVLDAILAIMEQQQ